MGPARVLHWMGTSAPKAQIFNGRDFMVSSRLRLIALLLAVAGATGIAVSRTQATPAKCLSTPVPGQSDLHIVTCKTRP
jgi:hypothetical protein